ncbi:MAG: sporulation protein YunB [Bacilli bacterium]|nr:sporulation protein YunB [Bacilli bacterium]
MRKMHLIHKIKISLFKKILIILLILIIIFVIFFSYLKKHVTPLLIEYTILESKKRSNSLISSSIREINMDTTDLYKINASDNIIEEVEFDTLKVNNYLSDISLKILENMKKLNNSISFDVPLTLVYNNPFLTNLSYKIPIKINFINSLTSNINTKITNYGINNAIVEVSVKITIEEVVIIPFKTEIISVSQDIPILFKMVNGNIPEYYSGIEGSSNSFSIPIK